MKKHYGDQDGLKVLSFNAIVTEVLSTRNYGKTWTFKRRAFRRALKRGKKTIWLRMFKKEVKEAVAKFFRSKDLQKYCGISFYNAETNPKGNLKQIGNTFYYRKSPTHAWDWFLQVFALSDVDALRSADDVDVDTIVFDEFAKTPEKNKRYRGNMVNDFIDILFSSKREHEVRCILLGNKECVNNPFNTYFGIKSLPNEFNGIKSYRGGSFVIQQINVEEEASSEYETKLKQLLEGTSYGNYIYKNEYKNNTPFKIRKTPSNSSVYAQLWINNYPIKISVLNGLFYFNDRIDKSKRIYCDVMPSKFIRESLLVKKQRRFFLALVNALADNRIYYDTPATYEIAQSFFAWLSV